MKVYSNKAVENGARPGDVLELYGRDWTVLDTDFPADDGRRSGVLCLMREPLRRMRMGGGRRIDYSDTDPAAWLEEQGLIFKGDNALDGLWVALDLTADDGTYWNRMPYETDGFFLLTKELYRRYRREMEPGEPFWLATKLSGSNDPEGRFCAVDFEGLPFYEKQDRELGVLPAFVFSKRDFNRGCDRE